MAVPLLDLNAQNLPLENDLKAAFERVLKSGHFIMGPEITAFESEIARFIGVKHAIGVSSGTDAILLALMALDIKPGDEVLCPSYTFFATAGCVARAGALPVFVDSVPDTFNLDVNDAAKKISSRTKAIVPVHLFGQCAEMDAVLELAKRHDLAVIEDAAQSLGARYKGRSAGTIGTFGTYSFFPSKNLGGLGDGGLVVTNDDVLTEKARLLRTHGSKPKYYHKYVGGNFRLDALQAAFLRVKLPHYNDYTGKRRANAAYYTEKLSKMSGVVLASDYKAQNSEAAKLVLPMARPECDHIWNQYTLRIPGGKRDSLKDFLTKQAIGTEIYYPVPMHKQECFAYTGQADTCPAASQLANEALSMPIYPELRPEQREEVVAALRDFVK
jgi:dTDP-4-amino-4,6-dideoxygalactose transaminase